MKRIGWPVLMVIAFGLAITGCRKNLQEPEPEPVGMEDLTISPGFSWETNQKVEFVITSGFSSVITIATEEGTQVLHQGFNNHPELGYRALVVIPSYIHRVLVNGQSVEITGSTVPVTLTGSCMSLLSSSGHRQLKDIPLEGLVAAWHFDENSGTTAGDAMGSHDGTVTGAEWVPGISNSALAFNGTNGQVQIPNGGNFNPTGEEISFSLWFNLQEAGNYGAFIYQNVKYLVWIDNVGKVSFALYTPTWHSIYIDWANRIIDTDWHHVAATYDGAQMKLYLDGTLMKTGDVTGPLQTSVFDVIIGNQSSINHFGGIIDEVLVYDRALTATEVATIYSTTPDPGNGSGDLVSSWHLNENSGATAYDGTDGNNGTISGATWTQGIMGSGLHFDGATGNVNVANAANLNPVSGITMMAWARTEENKTCKVFQKGDWDGHGIGQGNWDGWQVYVRLSDNTSKSIHWGDGLPVMDQWYHIAMTYDGTILKMYINGQLKNSLAASGVLKVNTRTLSIGSDNGAQKFFHGDIDECLFFDRALTQTEIQANYTEQGNSPDQDGDGVADEEDAYPEDPARAFNNYYPAMGFGSLAFEDLWPATGDYDFNDLVMDYRFKTVTNGNNKVTEVFGTFVVRAIGAGLHNGFGFQLPASSLSQEEITVTGYDLQEGYVTLNANGTEANQEKITVILFEDAYDELLSPGGGIGVNVVPGETYVDPDTMVITIACTPNLYSLDDVGLADFNPFLIVNQDRGREVHLPDMPPTSLADPSYFGTDQDDSDPATGRYYKTENNLPWAINIAESYDYTIEKDQITSAYIKFAPWAESSGSLFPDWYHDLSGYRNETMIYQVP